MLTIDDLIKDMRELKPSELSSVPGWEDPVRHCFCPLGVVGVKRGALKLSALGRLLPPPGLSMWGGLASRFLVRPTHLSRIAGAYDDSLSRGEGRTKALRAAIREAKSIREETKGRPGWV